MNTKSSGQKISVEKLAQAATILWCISIGWSVGIANLLMVVTSALIVINIACFKKYVSLKDFLLQPLPFLYLLLALSILWSENYTDGISKLKTYLPLLLFPLVLQYWIKYQPQVIKQGVQYLSLSLVFGIIIVFAVNTFPIEMMEPLLGKFRGIIKPYPYSDKSLFGWYVPFMERINFCNILNYAGIALTFLFIQEKRKYYLLTAILFLSTSFWMGARASMIATVLILPFLILFSLRKQSVKVIFTGIFISIVTITIVFYLVKPNIESRLKQTKYELESLEDGTYLEKDYKHFTTLIRMISWRNSWEVFQEKSLIGQGIGDYPTVFESKYEKNKLEIPIHYHSQWLYLAGVFGILGIAAFLIITLIFAYNIHHKTAVFYFITFSIYTATVWIFDTLLLQKEEMMALALFLSFTIWLKKSDILYT